MKRGVRDTVCGGVARRGLFVVLAGLFLVIVLSLTTLLWGRVVTILFSPDLFEFKRNVYYALPGGGFKLWTASEETFTTVLVDYWRSKRFLKQEGHHNERWCLVQGWEHTVWGWKGPAYWMLHFDEKRFIQWSEDHPELGRFLWPRVIAFIREERYGEAWILALLMGPPSDMLADEYAKRLESLCTRLREDLQRSAKQRM